ncbi:MAG: hypothetical protein ABSH15_00340 [Verrucomicrobiota bacterium]
MEPYHNTAIVFGDVREALLYYDYIVPANMGGNIFGVYPSAKDNAEVLRTIDSAPDPKQMFLTAANMKGVQLLEQTLPPQWKYDSEFGEAVRELNAYVFGWILVEQDIGCGINLTGTSPLPWMNPSKEDVQRAFAYFIKEFSLEAACVDCPALLINTSKDATREATAIFHGLQLVDTSNVTISHIVEFRKDREAFAKMKKFRLFAYENYSGKSKAYVEDDIQKRLADYHEVVKSWGFETKLKSLHFLLNSKFLAGAFATSVAAILMRKPEVALAAFSTGAVVEIGKLSLEYAKCAHELRKIARDNPISYIADAKKALES